MTLHRQRRPKDFAAASLLAIVLTLSPTSHAFAPPSSLGQKTLGGATISRTNPHESPTKCNFFSPSTTASAHSSPLVLSMGSNPIPSGIIDSSVSNEIVVYLLQTLISVGVPALASVIVILFAAKAFSKKKGDRDGFMNGSQVVDELYEDLYGPPKSSPSLPFSFGKSRRPPPSALRNLGIPATQYITVTKLNDILNSYKFSIEAAIGSKSAASSNVRSDNFERAFGKAVGSSLTAGEKEDLIIAEKLFLKTGGEILGDMEMVQKSLVGSVIEKEMKKMNVKVGEVDVEVLDADDKVLESGKGNETRVEKKKEEGTPMWKKMTDGKERSFQSKLSDMKEINEDLLKLELEFLRVVVEILGAKRANGVRAALLGNIEGGNGAKAGSLLSVIKERPLTSILSNIGYIDASTRSKNLFITDFPGDVSASQVEELREEVTAIIRSAQPGDEALLVLQSGGGTVTGYGLAAAQLQRFKEKGMKLTICVEQVAASGGYMMCCVADKIVASPFAVLGSIGVISEIPNVYERLKKEGIEFQTVTAGKYKRTLTPTKKPSKEDFEKSQKDIEKILNLFKAFVKSNRPSLDIDNVATGETWFGEDALEKGLCDEIKTKDDVLLEFVDEGYNVFSVKYELPKELPDSLLGFAGATGSNARSDNEGGFAMKGVVKRVVKFFMKEVKQEFMELYEEEFSGSGAGRKVNERVMAKDVNSADKIRFEDKW